MLLQLLSQAIRHRDEPPALPVSHELERARTELAVAWQHFDQAEPAFVDAAIHRLVAAERAYCTLLKEQKISFSERSFSLEIIQ
ncbi:hypothetical protein GE107_07205 [Cohnella sp. CFH 77786]|uniref:hypothetical protein n=1 Tax=Cohnella sp. CFH 77786 TaxID=2662265 RepID=UPI001C60A2E4|nr:hypothetical protein [Cohnella sp. CFH 77786]MBW5445846.1 hypothetical protein [Cohnella sp. CFH 77786]